MGIARLYRLDYATVAADGTATVTHRTGGFDWVVKLSSISCVPGGSVTRQPTCVTYRNQVQPEMQLDPTSVGNADSSNTEVFLSAGEAIIASWTGAPVGSRVSFRIEGVQYDPGEGLKAIA